MTVETHIRTRRRSSTAAKPAGAAKRKPATRSASAKPSGNTHFAAAPDEATRHEMIAVAAYFRAQQRGFSGGDPLQDWVQAEAEIARLFSR